MTTPFISIENLTKYFTVSHSFFGAPKTVLKAVDNISLKINKGETLGLVGESGCGKSTAGRTIAGLYQPTSGTVLLGGENVHQKLTGPAALKYRLKIQMIFQDPYSSLNPRMTVGDIIGEPLQIHKIAAGAARQKRIYELLNQVGLSGEHAGRFPHEFSGGQRQRVGIARALAVNPEFIICDEAISALDVSIQAQVVNLLKDLQNEYGLTYLFIAHDLNMVKYISHYVAVMYLGSIVEIAPSEALYEKPLHPYTQSLLAAIPKITGATENFTLKGEIPSPLDPPSGCKFSSRCQFAAKICSEKPPVLKSFDNRHVSCHFVNT